MSEMISVVTSIYNVEAYLNKFIESMLKQTYQNFELILVDDGSPDNCPAICDEWGKKDTRIRVFHKQNGGLSSGRNCGIEHAKGKYITFPDPDDWIEPNYLEKLISLTINNSADVGICGHYYGEAVGDAEASAVVMDTDEAMKRLMLPHSFCGYMWNKLYRMDIINKFNLRNDTELGMIEDLHFNIQYFQLCKRIAYDPEPVYHYVINQTGVTSRYTPLTPRKISGLLTYKKIAELLHGKYPDLEAIAYSSLCNMCLQDIMVYYRTGMNSREILDLVRKDFLQYRKYFYKSREYTTREKRCSKFAVIHPKVYYYARRIYLRFFGKKKNKKKILICNDLLRGGGTETLLQLFTAAFIEKGHDVTIMARKNANGDNKAVMQELFPSGVHYIQDRYPTKKYKWCIPLTALNFLIRKIYRMVIVLGITLKNYDFAIAIKDGYITKDVAALKAKHKIAWIQSDYRIFHQNKDYIQVFSNIEKERECLKSFDKIVCVSETARESVIETVGDTGNLCVRYNPIDVKKILSLSKEKCEFTRNQTGKLIVSVGGLYPNKNYLTLLKACSLLREKTEFELWIISDGPEKDKIKDFIKKNNLTNVKMLGMQKNPYPMIRQADLYVSASITESYGLAVQESLILGVPVVAVKNPGIIESLDTRFGVLTDNSAEDIACAVLNLFEDDGIFEKYRETIKEKYPINSLYKDRMEKICGLLD